MHSNESLYTFYKLHVYKSSDHFWMTGFLSSHSNQFEKLSESSVNWKKPTLRKATLFLDL